MKTIRYIMESLSRETIQHDMVICVGNNNYHKCADLALERAEQIRKTAQGIVYVTQRIDYTGGKPS